MEEAETVPILSRKELRKQKLMEYLAGKGKLKQPNPKPYLLDTYEVKKPLTSTLKVVKGKENKTPADRLQYEGTKNKSLAPQHPAKGRFGLTYKVNEKSSILTGRQNTNTNRPSATCAPAQPKLIQNSGMYSVVPSKANYLKRQPNTGISKSNQNATNNLKKKQNTGIPSSVRVSSNVVRTAVTKSNGRFGRTSNAAWSCPTKTLSDRMSLGPMVKTKTGLIPAVTHPRTNQTPNLTHTSATSADTTTATAPSVANKVRSSTSSSVSVSHKSSVAQRKTLPTTALKNPVERSRTGIKVQHQNKCNLPQPLLGKHSLPSCKSQLSSGLKSASTSSKGTAAPNKPEGRSGMSKMNKPIGQPIDRFTKQRSEGEGQKNGRVPLRTSSGPASRRTSRPVCVGQNAVAGLGGKTKTNAPPQEMGKKRTSAPVMSQTAPQPARTISYTGQPKDTKTSKIPTRAIPQTEGKKPTAAQEERMRKLQEWREAKGISYKRPPMAVKPQVRRTVAVPQPFWSTMKEEDEAHSLICAVDRSLADCIKLLGEGCPSDQVKEVLARLPAVSQKFAKYWICRARLMEQEGSLDVLPMFEEAVAVVLEPVDELRAVVFEILKKKDEIQASKECETEEDQIPTGESTPDSFNNPMMTPKPVRALICGEKGNSSVIKYKITATPGRQRGTETERSKSRANIFADVFTLKHLKEEKRFKHDKKFGQVM
ncbi:cytoskeleton-associated protein 2-like isoform X2 [Centropristis striata]|uniref:cytoskeleton-associated protein 2-like isoform X2 n=1 Tax=Centropristis striata TaxID=184440 RepID=UPI0027E13E39|nr:cytoskeleton-associated protein 2-like isoform X2 [Centropristis striata]